MKLNDYLRKNIEGERLREYNQVLESCKEIAFTEKLTNKSVFNFAIA